MKKLKNLTSIIALLFLTSNSFAADVTIEMLNKLGNESMVYSEKIVRVNVGDTVFWKSTTPSAKFSVQSFDEDSLALSVIYLNEIKSILYVKQTLANA